MVLCDSLLQEGVFYWKGKGVDGIYLRKGQKDKLHKTVHIPFKKGYLFCLVASIYLEENVIRYETTIHGTQYNLK